MYLNHMLLDRRNLRKNDLVQLSILRFRRIALSISIITLAQKILLLFARTIVRVRLQGAYNTRNACVKRLRRRLKSRDNPQEEGTGGGKGYYSCRQLEPWCTVQ